MIYRYKKFALQLLRIAALIIPFIWIFKQIEISEFLPAIKKVEWWTIPVFLTANLIVTFLQGTRWWVLLHAFSKKLSFLRSISYHFSSHFYSLVLPNGSAQEVVRTLFVTKETGSIISWSAAWICKITTAIISFIISFSGLLIISKSGLPDFVTQVLILLFILITVLITISFTKRFTHPVDKLLHSFKHNKIINWLGNLKEGIYQYRTKIKELSLVLALTSLMELILLIGIVFIMHGITGTKYIAECMAFIPLIELVSMLQPFTPNGIGVREALVALMFKHIGLSNEELGIYIIISNLPIFIKLTGAIPVLHGIVKKKSRERVTADLKN
ncbi:MAG TPA: lysylphosphatidylglycerol synthase transmembrane domain-containing protein [Chitinispirillaceae bacterium]|jgi:uncharacterized protein (TIRG00374 family)|nr:lysylphosphatidylglycerol synthase transmembrane domain-containing protein [Chitinispirillaceae bacterium]